MKFEITEYSFLHYECDCGANFPMEENRVDENTFRCPACAQIWKFKNEGEKEE